MNIYDPIAETLNLTPITVNFDNIPTGEPICSSWNKGLKGKYMYPAWNKGLTKQTDKRVAKYSDNLKGRKSPHAKGLPKGFKHSKETINKRKQRYAIYGNNSQAVVINGVSYVSKNAARRALNLNHYQLVKLLTEQSF